MKTENKVSVVIPCYNCAKTICETLESLERQTVCPFEVICIDDGSTDCTKVVVSNYLLTSKMKIKLISKKNNGVGSARNFGIKESTGDVLLFLDSDDIYSKYFIEEIIENMDNGIDSVCGRFTRNIGLLSTNCKKYKIDNSNALMKITFHKESFHTSAFAYKKNIIIKNNLRFSEDLKYGEDWGFTTRYLSHCGEIIFLDGNYLFYRLTEKSAMNSISFNHVDAIKSAIEVSDYLKSVGSPFFDVFEKYMVGKAFMATAHTFAKAKRRDLFKKLINEFYNKNTLKKLAFSSKCDSKTRLSTCAFLLSRNCFYYIIGRYF